jgi:signal transduction histidine kinase/CheY-like chemotaxis protein
MGDESIEILAAFTGGILFELDGEGRYLRILSGDSVLLARPPHELIGRTVRDVLGSAGEPFEGICRRVAATGVVETYDYVLDVAAGRRSFRCEARRRIDEQGRATVLLLTRDVTDQTELQAKLIAAERFAAVGTMAASVAHEVRQPLAFATTSLEVLARSVATCCPTDARAAEALAHVRDAVNRMTEIAASIGMVATNRRSTPTTTSVLGPLEAALDLCASELGGRTHVCVDVDDAARVQATEGELCQVLVNVIVNAAQSMDPAKVQDNEIRAYTVRHGDMVRIGVRDTGSGIAPDVLGRIFDPFFTTKEEGRGTGLGLYVSRRIVERWGGRIGVTSTPGRGTTVEIDLPAAASTNASPKPPPVGGEPRRLRILVIDDEKTFLRSLQLVLEDTHDVTPVSNAQDALELLDADPQRFDAVLCDLSMPVIDGVAFYEHMKRLGISDRFVLMTGGAYTPRATTFLATVQCARIAKPFTPAQLTAVLARVTNDAAAPRE